MLRIFATLAVVVALLSGATALIAGGEIGLWGSIQWTTGRVGVQAVASLLTLLALFDLR